MMWADLKIKGGKQYVAGPWSCSLPHHALFDRAVLVHSTHNKSNSILNPDAQADAQERLTRFRPELKPGAQMSIRLFIFADADVL